MQQPGWGESFFSFSLSLTDAEFADDDARATTIGAALRALAPTVGAASLWARSVEEKCIVEREREWRGGGGKAAFLRRKRGESSDERERASEQKREKAAAWCVVVDREEREKLESGNPLQSSTSTVFPLFFLFFFLK